jgi:uncharacterized tellurite resistance protein B-like protein
MSDERTRVLALAKVLIAAAWADGTLMEEEKNSLKDLIFSISTGGYQLSAHEWDLLDLYMDKPVEAAERARLVADLQDAIRTPEEKQFVLQALQKMAMADGESNAEEQQIIQQMSRAVDKADVGMLDSLSRFLGGALGRRSTAVANAPNREIYFDDYLKNRVYYKVSQQLQEEGKTLSLSDAEMRRLGLAGGLMARIAKVDRDVSEEELQTMVAAIVRYWQLAQETAVFVANVALTALDVTFDYYRMTREFATTTTKDEQRRFLVVLFHVAAADGNITFEETEEIRLIANSLNLTHKDFIDAKLAVIHPA